MKICERLKADREKKTGAAPQQAGSFETDCGPAISKLASALKEAGHTASANDLMRTAYAKWEHLACGGADRLSDALASGKPVHNPQALLDAICKRLKEEGWKPMGRSRFDELMGDCGPSLW